MRNTLLIGLTINNKLKSTKAITDIVGTKIFPIVAENGTTFPFIVYTRSSVQAISQTKCGFVEDLVNFIITVAGDSYKSSVMLANEVLKAINVGRIKDDLLCVDNISLVSASEVYTDDSYVQTLTFSCRVQNS